MQADILATVCDDHTIECDGDPVMSDTIFLVLVLAFSALVLAFMAWVFLFFRGVAVSASRKVGAPHGRGTASFRGEMWSPDQQGTSRAMRL
jgi:hypothetical protein